MLQKHLPTIGFISLFISLINIAAADSDTPPEENNLKAGITAQRQESELQPPLVKEELMEERNDPTSVPTLAPTSTIYLLSSHGGNGGAYFGYVGGGVVYGVQINSGAFVDHIRVAYYVPTQPDNYYRTGDFSYSTEQYGGNGGGANPWTYCPAGQGVIGIRGASGSYVDRIGIICSDANNPDPNSSSNWYSDYYGGGGGGYFSDTCIGGYLMYAFNIRAGVYLDQIEGICIRAH